MMKGIKGIHHVAMSVPDLDRAEAFYCGVLGFEIADRFSFGPSPESDEVTGVRDAAAKVIMLRAGNMHLEIFEYHNPGVGEQSGRRPVCDHGYTHLALEVDGDIQQVYRTLAEAGVKWHAPVLDDLEGEGYAVTYGRDPFGNVLEIQKLSNGNPAHISHLPHWKA